MGGFFFLLARPRRVNGAGVVVWTSPIVSPAPAPVWTLVPGPGRKIGPGRSLLGAQKCALFQSEVEYLGHQLSQEGIKPLHSNIKAITDYPRPTTVKQLRSFNGMVNYYKRFIPKAEVLMQPLY